MSDDDMRAFGGDRGDGWSFVVILFRGQPSGEIRFAHAGKPAFTQPIGIEEIAVFASQRLDLVADLVDDIIAAHRPH